MGQKLCEKDEKMISQVAEDIKVLWEDPAIKKIIGQSKRFGIAESTEYFFQEIDRLASANYIPTAQDILNVREKTTNITEVEFSLGSMLLQ